MGEIKLTGLKSGVPIGFMAALGTFRQADAHAGARLGKTRVDSSCGAVVRCFVG